MAKVAEGIGKSYDEAVADALNKVGLTKEQVSVEIVEEPKKRLFSILDPKQVKVRITEIEAAPEVAVVAEKEKATKLNQSFPRETKLGIPTMDKILSSKIISIDLDRVA